MDPRERARLLSNLASDCCTLLAAQALGKDVSDLAARIKRTGQRLRSGGVSPVVLAKIVDDVEAAMSEPLKRITGVDVRRRQLRLVENRGQGEGHTIPLSRGKHALVSAEDHAKLVQFAWYCGHRGYAMRSKNMPDGRRKSVSMHREILGARADQEVDHINRNRLDNRRENLRVIGHSANLHNRRAYGSSKVAGVSWDKRKKKWRAEIGKNGRRAWLGYHDTKAGAEHEYRLASSKVYTGNDKIGD